MALAAGQKMTPEALAPFRILTGIECDINVDGSLDQTDELLGGVVAGCCFLVELSFLNGRERLAGSPGAPATAMRQAQGSVTMPSKETTMMPASQACLIAPFSASGEAALITMAS